MTAWWETLERFPFGDSPELADALLGLTLDGRKTATCWSAAEGLKGSEVGKAWVAVDGAGRPRAVLRTTELTRRRWIDVDAEFAFQEGEGDRSLADWREGHRAYFTRNGGFAEDMLLWCERFEVVEVLQPESGV